MHFHQMRGSVEVDAVAEPLHVFENRFQSNHAHSHGCRGESGRPRAGTNIEHHRVRANDFGLDQVLQHLLRHAEVDGFSKIVGFADFADFVDFEDFTNFVDFADFPNIFANFAGTQRFCFGALASSSILLSRTPNAETHQESQTCLLLSARGIFRINCGKNIEEYTQNRIQDTCKRNPYDESTHPRNTQIKNTRTKNKNIKRL